MAGHAGPGEMPPPAPKPLLFTVWYREDRTPVDIGNVTGSKVEAECLWLHQPDDGGVMIPLGQIARMEWQVDE